MHLAEPDRVQTIAGGFNLGNRAAAPINETLHHVPLLRPLLRLGVAPLQELSQMGHHHLFRRHLQLLFRGLRRAACFGLQRGCCRRWRRLRLARGGMLFLIQDLVVDNLNLAF